MRQFTKEENKFIEDIVLLKRNRDFTGLQVSKLLRSYVDFLAVSWEVGDSPKVQVFSTADDSKSKMIIDNEYFKIVDFVYFVKELVSLGFISLQSVPSTLSDEWRIIYNRERYRYDNEKKQFIDKDLGEETSLMYNIFGDFENSVFDKSENSEGIGSFSRTKHNNTFANDLEEIAYSIIYPRTLAEDYVQNSFKTLEQKQFDKQIKKANWSFWAALAAAGISLLFGIIQCCQKQTIDERQISEIQRAIQSTKIETPIKAEIVSPVKVEIGTPIKAGLSDTIKVKQVK
jgi:hypothetical protein